MLLRLDHVDGTPAPGVACLRAVLPPQSESVQVSYKTRTGALLRVDGVAAGAFDREHHDVLLPPSDTPRELVVEVELEALPTNGLPSGPGVVWWYLNKRARQRPLRALEVRPLDVARGRSIAKHARRAPDDDDERDASLKVIGHSHLDVAWLWTYEQTRRKAQRTFAIACDLLDRDSDFIFIQSQPQLYAFVEEDDAQLFERVRAHVGTGRWDPGVAALWVESDCNVPSGESLLRQMLFAERYCRERFGASPRIAWLPDSFGFANTLPQLLAHAGIPYFATTKLQWNDTIKFPYPQFVWEGPDGSSVVAALIQSYDGGPYPWRVARAKQRREPLVVGYGDGGGGVTSKMLEQVDAIGTWIHPGEWFDELASRRDDLPFHRDELYLEFHRGVYTTHHGLKSQNALLERALNEAEELLAWCVAVHAPASAIGEFAGRLNSAWEIVLRNQFHDVLPGTSITPVYIDAADEMARAGELVVSVIASTQSMLPRALGYDRAERRVEPVEEDGRYIFDNSLLHAEVLASGTIVDLRVKDGRSVVSQANVLALYEDKPKQWDAWNIDNGYQKSMRHAAPGAHRIEDGALLVDFTFGASPGVMRISLTDREPFLRVELETDWKERRTLLRVENWLPLRTAEAIYGSPHGTVTRSARRDTPQERAKFEVPGQRFACVRDPQGDGFAHFALDTYGWSARSLANGGVQLGHSLLRGTVWPDPQADLGTQRFSYAFAPFAQAGTGALETAWLQFAHEPRVRLFTSEDQAVLVVACKRAEDGDGVIVRVRECDGTPRSVRLRCGARMTEAVSTDALERGTGAPVEIREEALAFDLAAHQIRTFRVRFSHA